MSYSVEYNTASDSSEAFWASKAGEIPWYSSPIQVLSNASSGRQSWFADGLMNTCYMAVDYHVQQGRGLQAALIYDSPVAGIKASYSYKELQDHVSITAGMLSDLGVVKGDRVVIYMPMIPETVFAMLACARLGAIHSVVFGGFAPRELAIRIDDAKPVVVLSASCGIEGDRVIDYKPLVDAALDLASFQPSSVVVFQRPQSKADLLTGRDADWAEQLSNATPVDCVPVKGADPLYILYTSGTTGKPKGVVRENGGHAVALHYSMKAIYDMEPGDVYWAASDVGWVVGHSYIVYAPLLRGCTSVMYEGKPTGTPDAGAFWRVIAEYKVRALFSAPTAFRAIRKEDPQGELARQYDLSSLQRVFSAGERLDPPTYNWMTDVTGKAVIDHWWQTETGWAIAANMTGVEEMPCKAGSATVPVPGYQVEILDHAGNKLPAGVQGNIAIKLPLPPSCLNTLWKDAQRFIDSYLATFPGYYTSGDGGYFDEDGYLFVMGRLDDVINVAGHRLSTGEIEEVLGSHATVAEAAVVAKEDTLKGHVPVGFVVLKSGISVKKENLEQELVTLVRSQIGAIACFKLVRVCDRLPKTRSGKTLRKTIRQIVNKQPYVAPATIDDPKSLSEIEQLLQD